MPELEAPAAESLAPPRSGAKVARAAALAASRARQRIASLPHVAVRFAEPQDSDLAYGASLLVASPARADEDEGFDKKGDDAIAADK